MAVGAAPGWAASDSTVLWGDRLATVEIDTDVERFEAVATRLTALEERLVEIQVQLDRGQELEAQLEQVERQLTKLDRIAKEARRRASSGGSRRPSRLRKIRLRAL